MAQQLTLTNSGLYSAPNPFSQVPQGAMVTADNLVIDNNGVLEPRRGLDILNAFPSANDRAARYTSFQSQLLSVYGTSDLKLAYDNSGTWSTYTGTFRHPDAVLARIRFLQAASNLYFTSSAGIQKLDSYTSQPTQAGMYKGLDLVTTATGSSGFLTHGTEYSINGYTQIGSAAITGVPNTSSLVVNQYVTGTGIPAGAQISSISGSTVTLSQNATATNVKGSAQAAITSGSTQMLGLSSTSGIAAGQYVFGQGLEVGTTVASITGNNVILSIAATQSTVTLVTTGSTHTNTTLDSLASTAGIVVGQYVTGTGIPAGTTVSALAGTTVTLSAAATSTSTGLTVTFFSPNSGSAQFTFYDSTTWTAFAGNSVGYRMLWGIEDANKNIILGEPSGRSTCYNTAATAVNVNAVFSIPSGITTSHFYQLYRTLSSGGNFDPGDEEQLVFEGNPTSGEISAGSVTVLDQTPDSLLGEALYTNASQQGITQANTPPPLAWDIANFRNYTFYANTTSKQRLILTMLAAGNASGVSIGDVLTIAGVTYTGAAAQTSASGQFKVFSTGTPSQNIANTAQSLVAVINQYASTTLIYATYISGESDLPGQILLEERGLGGSTFTATASAHGSAWNPVLPTSGSAVISSNSMALNGLYYSKSGQPEAVPLLNNIPIGSAAYKILRILPLQNSLLILKEQEGLFRLYGYDPTSFVVDLVDASARLLAPDSAVVLNNQVWALTDQGVTTLSDTGSSVDSRPIEDKILALFGADLAGVKQFSTGIAYETDRKYILFTVSGASDTSPTQAFVYNTFTRAFTRWPLSKTCGFINPVDNKLYLGDAATNETLVERKTYTYQDFIDPGSTYTILSSSGFNVYLNSTNQISVGDLLYQSATVNSLISAVQPGYVTVQSNLTWVNGSATVYPAISCLAEWTPISVSNPGTIKQCPEVSLIFRNQGFNQASLSFASDVSQNYDPVTLYGTQPTLWALFPWGTPAWGGASVAGPIRALIPREKQRCSELRMQFAVKQGYANFQLLGLSIPVTDDQSYFVNR